MPLPGTQGENYRFGAFELASGTGELRKHGLRLKLQEQPVRLLIVLLENAGDVVTREQIKKRLWADDVHVDYENAINSAVRKLREVLVDTSDNPRYVETLAKRGYRFIAPVSRTQQASAVADVIPVETPAEIPQQAEDRPIARKLRWLLPAGALIAISVIGGTAFWFEHSKVGSESPLQSVPLTAYPGYEVSPSFSPDGNQIAFSWNGENGDNTDIYVKLIGSDRPLRLTTDPAPDMYPAWSPDGRSIAFKRVSSGNTSILLIPPLGGAEREVAQLGRSFSIIAGWSPDGHRLLISWADKADEPAKLFWVSVETGEKQRITSPPPETVGDQWCSISPDGRTIAFARALGGGLIGGAGSIGDLYTLPLTSNLVPKGEPKRLTFDNVSVGSMAWTADSREIVFSSGRSGSPALWRMPVSGSEKPRRLEVGENGARPAISVRSNRLVYEHQVPPDTNIWRMDLSNPALPAVSFIVSTRQETDAQYSPDGKRIVFRSDRSGTLEIWECDADGSNPVQLTNRGLSGSPRWSSDSRLIAFDSPVDGRYQIFVMAANGGQQQQLTRSFVNTRPNWSHDGRWLYFASNRTGRDEVWRMPANGGTATQVTRNGGSNPAESADGAAIYYDSDRTIMKAAPDGSGEIRVVDAMGALNGRNFALTKEGIFYRTSVSDLGVWFLSFGDGKSRRILKTDKPVWTGLGVSPDGHWLLYTQVDRKARGELMLIENFH